MGFDLWYEIYVICLSRDYGFLCESCFSRGWNGIFKVVALLSEFDMHFCNVVLGALGNVTMEQFCVTLCLVVKKSKEEEILKK